MAVLLRLLGALHARGYHAAVIAGLVMMPAVAAVGFWTDRLDSRPTPAPIASSQLRGSLDDAVLPSGRPQDGVD